MQRFMLAICTTILIATMAQGQATQQMTMQQAAADSTVIDVTIEGMPAGKVRLVGTFGDQNYIADSSMADAGGHFVLRRAHPLLPGYYTFLMSGRYNFSILVDNEDQHISVKAKATDIFASAEIKGSPNTELFFQNMRFQIQQEPAMNAAADQLKKFPPNTPEYQQAKAKQTALLAERKAHLEGIYKANPNSFFTKFKIAGQNPDFPEFKKPNGEIDTARQVSYYRNHFWDGVDFTDNRLLHTPVITNKLRRYMKDLTPQRPDSLIKVSDELIRRVMPHKEYFKFFVNWIALQYENGKTTVMDGEAVYVHIIQTFVTPELAFWDKKENIESLRKHAWEMEASLLGKKGPDVQAKNPQGEMKSIYEMTAPIIVIFMFSPDCEHCQKESPEIEAIYEKWKNKGVDFFGIGVNTNDADWKAFVKKNNFTFTNVFDPTNRAIYAKYFVDITPELYVLNKDRIIVGKNLHPDQLEEVFEREFRKMK